MSFCIWVTVSGFSDCLSNFRMTVAVSAGGELFSEFIRCAPNQKLYNNRLRQRIGFIGQRMADVKKRGCVVFQITDDMPKMSAEEKGNLTLRSAVNGLPEKVTVAADRTAGMSGNTSFL